MFRHEYDYVLENCGTVTGSFRAPVVAFIIYFTQYAKDDTTAHGMIDVYCDVACALNAPPDRTISHINIRDR